MSSNVVGSSRRRSIKCEQSTKFTALNCPLDSSMDGIFDRRLRGLLNKITKESFTTISTQVVTPINGSESNAQTLLRVVRLVYEHGIDDVAFSDIYARLCRTIMEEISPNIADDSQDKPVAGGPLFRKYLLDHCQEQFERLWSTSDTSLVAVTGDETLGGERFFSVEYYAAQKAKRQRRGLVRFVGELYKLQMLTDKVVHDCIMRFLKDDLPGEEDIETVCMLLSVAGQSLDTKAPLHVNAYFERMGQLVKMELLSFRAKALLMDVIELRQRSWVARSAGNVLPTTREREAIVRQRVLRER